jgi:hypothetical protein
METKKGGLKNIGFLSSSFISLIQASPRNVSDKLLTEERKKERKKERRIRNGANTICLPNFVWGT